MTSTANLQRRKTRWPVFFPPPPDTEKTPPGIRIFDGPGGKLVRIHRPASDCTGSLPPLASERYGSEKRPSRTDSTARLSRRGRHRRTDLPVFSMPSWYQDTSIPPEIAQRNDVFCGDFPVSCGVPTKVAQTDPRVCCLSHAELGVNTSFYGCEK